MAHLVFPQEMAFVPATSPPTLRASPRIAAENSTFNGVRYAPTSTSRRTASLSNVGGLSRTECCAASGDDVEEGAIISPEGTLAPGIGSSVCGVYSILDADDQCRTVGISRDVYTTLARCLVRQPARAYSYRLKRFARPSRKLLEDTRSAWAVDAVDPDADWTPIDITAPEFYTQLSDAAREKIEGAEMPGINSKALKAACREIQKDIEQKMNERGLKDKLKFAPKLKDKGILDVESVKIPVPETI